MIERIYLLNDLTDPSKRRLVRATSGARALRHVTKGAFSIKVASTNDVASLMDKGTKIEDAEDDGDDKPGEGDAGETVAA